MKADQLLPREEWERGVTKGCEETLRNDVYIQYPDCGDCFIDIHTCQNSSNFLL